MVKGEEIQNNKILKNIPMRGGTKLLSGEVVNQVLIITLDGELDMHTVTDFKQFTQRHLNSDLTIKDLVLQMDKIKFIDSSGLGAILGLYKQINQRNGKLIYVACSPQVFRILKLSGMQKIAHFTDSVSEALSL